MTLAPGRDTVLIQDAVGGGQRNPKLARNIRRGNHFVHIVILHRVTDI